MSLDCETVEFYWKAITVIEAQNLLLELKVSDFPQLKKEDRKKFHKDIHRKAFPGTHSDAPVSTQELARRLGLALNG